MNKIYLPKEKLENMDESIIHESWEIKVRLNQLSLDDNRIIALSGDHGVGKDVWAKIIQLRSPKHKIIRFADPLRFLFEAAGISENQLDRLKRTHFKLPEGFTVGGCNVSGMTLREAMIHVAEDHIKPKEGEDYFAKIAIQRMRDALTYNENIIITDLRFDIENELLSQLASEFNCVIDRNHIPSSLPAIVAL